MTQIRCFMPGAGTRANRLASTSAICLLWGGKGTYPDIEFRYRLTLADARHSSRGVSAFGG